MSYISVKLPTTVVTLLLPRITTTAQVNIAAGSRRVTRAGNVRVTRAGNVRATRYAVTGYPEVIAVKLPDNVVSVPIP